MSKQKIPPPPPPQTGVRTKVLEQDIVYLDNGSAKPPPQAIDMEIAVLGAMLIDTRAVPEVINILTRNVFFKEEHRIVFDAIKGLYDDNVGIDLLTVSAELTRLGNIKRIGGDYYLIELTQKVSSAAHIEFHSRIILQKYILRELIITSRKVLFQALHQNPDVFGLIDEIEHTLVGISRAIVSKDGQIEGISAEDQLVSKVANTRSGKASGTLLGISEFDEWCGGLQLRELITLAARTGMGKTTAMMAISANIAIDRGEDVAFFSLEMSSIDLKYRIASRLTGIPYSKIRKAELTNEELQEILSAIRYLDKSKLNIYDALFHKNIHENIIKKIRELASQGVKFFVIDYVQLIKLLKSSTDRTGDLSKITRELKALTNELSITIVILAQVSRSTDGRTGSKVPMLSDLKQSGSIEEDSDMVIFLVRDAYYRQEKNSTIELPPHIAGDTNFIVAKGRSTGTALFRTYMDFSEYKMCSYCDSEF